MAKKKSTMRRGQMIAIAALFTSAVAPYAVSADTVTTTSTEVTTTEMTSYVEKNVDITVSTGDATLDQYTKVFFGNVDLEVAANGKKYAIVTLQDKSYAYPTLTDADGKEVEVVSQSGSAETKDWVRTIKLELDDKYQAKFTGGGTRATNFTIDLAHEKFDFEYESPLNSYFAAWLPNADVVTLKDGKKVAYVTFAGHSYAAETIYEGKDTSKKATVVSSTGTLNKDLVRVVRLELDANNKTEVFIPNERMNAAISFDFTEKAAVPNFTKAAELSKATALKVEYTAADPAGSWHPIAFPSTFTAAKAKAADGKINVVYTTVGEVTSVKVLQNGQEVPSVYANNELAFAVESLEGLTIEAGVNSERGASTYKVNVAKAQADASVAVTDFEVPVVKPAPAAIPTTTDVVGKKATVSFKTSSPALDSYFQSGDFFGGVEIVEIDGKSYADLNIVEKSIGLDYNYIMADGTVAEVAEISGNRATQNGEYDGFTAVIRIPVEVNDKGEFTFTLDTFGGQPGTESQAAYQFTFTGKIQNNVALPFTDVKNAETKEYVQQLANWGALNLGLTKFNPSNDMTRAQFSLMIARTLNLKPTKSLQFKDVKNANKETQDAIQALFEAGIVVGKTSTTFEPNAKISRQQAAVMIYRLMTKKLNYKATATADDLNFNDAADIKSAEAKLAFAALQKAGVMTGYQGFINPTSKLKRSQMAKILVESLNKAGFEK